MKHEFLHGAATSAHQVEGNNTRNDWWAWEQGLPLARRSGRACDHYRLWREDARLARELGHTAHRFSIEWSRVEPRPGQWDRAAIEHYREVLAELRRLGLRSFVTLHHFTNPQWLAKRGGWVHRETPERFAVYARRVAQELGELVDFWVTINEPMVYAVQSYLRGQWPPQRRNLWLAHRVIKQLARGHRRAYRAIRRTRPDATIGFAKHLVAYVPEHRRQLDDRLIVAAEDWWFNHRWFGLVGATYDFIGVNYYFHRKLRVHVWPPLVKRISWRGARSDMDWPIRPEGLAYVLGHMKRYGKPIYVTENGLADADDRHRADFIRDHLRAVESAQAEGVDVRGYLHWSLLDNFEWADGFEPRFGLVEVDYATMERRVRESAYVYRAIIEQARLGRNP